MYEYKAIIIEKYFYKIYLHKLQQEIGIAYVYMFAV